MAKTSSMPTKVSKTKFCFMRFIQDKEVIFSIDVENDRFIFSGDINQIKEHFGSTPLIEVDLPGKVVKK